MQAYIIVDLGFGDAGKGLLTDFLVRRTGADLVVRYNGGAQAGHNVVTPDRRHHTFAQFGSGTFNPGVRTFLSRYMVIHPTALLVEGDFLQKKGVQDVYDRLRISEDALIITPFHQAANRIRELLRGDNRHGSCGVGVGETVDHAHLHPADCIRAGDLCRPTELQRKLSRIREQKWAEIKSILGGIAIPERVVKELSIFEDESVMDTWINSIARITAMRLVVPDSTLADWLDRSLSVVFESAQGILLDAEAGFHPYTTWSDCTTAHAEEILAQMTPGAAVKRVGVMRTCMVRHGPGPLPTESGEFKGLISEHNQSGDWQGSVRYGWFDPILIRLALAINNGVDSIVLTHMDLLPKLTAWKYAAGYAGLHDLGGKPVAGEVLSNDPLRCLDQRRLSLEQRTLMTENLLRVEPMLHECESNGETVIEKVGRLIGKPVDILSHGVSADQVQVIKPLW